MMTSQKLSNVSVSESILNVLTEIKNHLQGRSDRIYEEIRTYPSPIPACDVQFNHLLEERAKLSKELNLVDTLVARCQDGSANIRAVEEFISSSNYFGDEMVKKLKAVINQKVD
jgi:hypothetical protein